MPPDVADVRDDFPVLDQEVNGQPLTYLDNAATTQTPRQVYETFEEYYAGYNANVHRGIHTLSHRASVAYEAAHDRLADFVGASGGREEMVFTRNTTESINLVAHGLALPEFGPGDAIVTTEMEHHASLVTWQQVAQRTGADLRFVELTDDGHLDVEHATSLIDDDVELVAVPQVSNVLGTVTPVSTFAELAHDAGAVLVVDGAQSAPTRPVDVEAMGADFFTFSGHKMAGPTGIGGLYGRKELLEEMEPFLYGGEMIQHVTFDRSTWNGLPWKFEAGTPPIAEAIALAAAVDYLDDLGMEWVREHENRLAQYALERLDARDDVETYGPGPGEERTGLVSFNVDGVHGHDLSSILDARGIAVRAGDHCTQPLHDKLDVPGSVRASFYVYNTTEEIDRLLDAIDGAAAKVDAHLSSDRYADRLYEHHQNPRNTGGLTDPSLVKSSEETTCGDEGEFHVDVAPDGTIERLAFESESCAVSRAVASLITEYLEGRTLAAAAEMEGEVASMLDEQFPALRRECVVGPEDVIREAAREYLTEKGTAEEASSSA